MKGSSGNDCNLEILTAQFQALLDLLERERAALIAHDGAELEAVVGEKNRVCQEIANRLAESPGLTGRQNFDELDDDHKSLLNLAQLARDSNLVNGKILHRSQQSVREILSILSGKSLDGLYEQSGQQTAVPEPGSTAIARA